MTTIEEAPVISEAELEVLLQLNWDDAVDRLAEILASRTDLVKRGFVLNPMQRRDIQRDAVRALIPHFYPTAVPKQPQKVQKVALPSTPARPAPTSTPPIPTPPKVVPESGGIQKNQLHTQPTAQTPPAVHRPPQGFGKAMRIAPTGQL